MNKESTKRSSSLSFVKLGKKYIFGIVATKVLIIWFICTRSSDLLPFSSKSIPALPKDINLTLYNITIFHIPLTDRKDISPFYIEVASDEWCFINGVDIESSKSQKQCKCLQNWRGMDCGVPEAVWNSSFFRQQQMREIEIRRRDKPRRIISSLLFSGEFALLDVIVRDTYPAIDVFLVPEEVGNPFSLLRSLKSGFLIDFQNRIMPIAINNSSRAFRNSKEWGIFMLENLWREAWKHVADFRPDDLFLFSHVSSILSKDVLLFLKLYDGYSEPFQFVLKSLLFQFQRLIIDNSLAESITLFEPIGCTYEYLTIICNHNVIDFLNQNCVASENTKAEFEKDFWNLGTWVIGSNVSPGGWQCNWCVRRQELENILNYYTFFLRSSNISDFHLNDTTATHLDKKLNKWFNFSDASYKISSKSDGYFAPDIVLKNSNKYSFLINGPMA